MRTLTKNMINRLSETLITVVFVIFFSQSIALGYNFEDDFQKISQNLEDADKLTVLFNQNLSADLNEKLDLVKLKSEFINNLAFKVTITDPFYVSDYLDRKRFTAIEIIEKQPQRQMTLADLENSHFLLIDLLLNDEDSVVFIYSIYEGLNTKSFTFKSLHLLEKKDIPKNTNTKKEINISEVAENLNLGTVAFNRNVKNSSWNYFHPSAFLEDASNKFSLDIGTWIRDNDRFGISLKHLRVEYRKEFIQGGLFLNSDVFHKITSGYGHVKLNFVSQDNINIPLFVSLGAKVRLYWNNNNYRFEKNSKKYKADARTLYLAANYFFNFYNIYSNLGVYVENLYAGLNLEITLPYRVAVSTNLFLPFYKADYENSCNFCDRSSTDWAFIIKHLSAQNFNISLSYQLLPKTMALNLNFSL